MKLPQRLLLIGVSIIVLKIASTSADIIVQPGYGQSDTNAENPKVNTPRDQAIVGSPQMNLPNNAEVRSNYGQVSVDKKPENLYERTIMLERGYGPPNFKVINSQMNQPQGLVVYSGYEPMQCWLNCMPYRNLVPNWETPMTLSEAIHRDPDLHRGFADKLYNAEDERRPTEDQRSASFRLFERRRPYYSKYEHRFSSPYGWRGYNRRKYGWGHSRSAVTNADCTDKVQYSRSLDNEQGPTTGLDEIHAVASNSPVVPNNYSKIPDSSSNIESDDGIAKKKLDPRQIGKVDNYVPLEYLTHQGYRDIFIPGMKTQLVNTARALGQTIADTVSPIYGKKTLTIPQQNSGYFLGAIPLSSQDLNAYGNIRPSQPNNNRPDVFRTFPQSIYQGNYRGPYGSTQSGNNAGPSENTAGYDPSIASLDPGSPSPKAVSISGIKSYGNNLAFGVPRMNDYSMPYYKQNPYGLMNNIDYRSVPSSIPSTLNTMIANPNFYLSPSNMPSHGRQAQPIPS